MFERAYPRKSLPRIDPDPGEGREGDFLGLRLGRTCPSLPSWRAAGRSGSGHSLSPPYPSPSSPCAHPCGSAACTSTLRTQICSSKHLGGPRRAHKPAALEGRSLSSRSYGKGQSWDCLSRACLGFPFPKWTGVAARLGPLGDAGAGKATRSWGGLQTQWEEQWEGPCPCAVGSHPPRP